MFKEERNFLGKNDLFIFMHVPKCAGTEIREHLYTKYDREEVLNLYEYIKSPDFTYSYKDVDKQLNALTEEKKKKINFIFGDLVYYGIHEHFKGRNPKYITFLRDPIERTISHYNSDLMKYYKKILTKDQILKIFPKSDDLSFNSWFNSQKTNKVPIDNYSFRFLLNFAKKENFKKDIISIKNIEIVRSILNDFFFIGLTHHPEDFYFLYNIFNIEKLIKKQNVSSKYLKPVDIHRIRKEYSKEFKTDEEVYLHAYELNKIFKSKNSDPFPNKKISVIMTSFNHENFISEAIDSVISQSYKNWELIIFDDGSTDNSRAIIQKYELKHKDKIKLYTHTDNQNLGLSTTYKEALNLAKGDFIAFLESDDVWLYDSLAIKLNAFEKHEHVDLVFCGVYTFGDEREINQRRDFIKSFSPFEKFKPFKAFNYLSLNNIIPTFSTVMIRNKFKDLKFSKKHNPWTDWWLWTQISLKDGYFYYIPLKKTKWRVSRNSYHSQFIKSLDDLDLYYKSFRNELFEFFREKFKGEKGEGYSEELFQSYLDFCDLYKRTQNKLDFYFSKDKLASFVNNKENYFQEYIDNVDKILFEKDESLKRHMLVSEKVYREKDETLQKHIKLTENISQEKDEALKNQITISENNYREKDRLLNSEKEKFQKLLEENENKISDLMKFHNEELHSKEKIINQKDSLIQNYSNANSKLTNEKELILKNHDLEIKNNSIQFKTLIEEKDAQLEDSKQLFNEKNDYSENLKTLLYQKESIIEKKTNLISQKDKLINDLNKLLTQKESLIEKNMSIIEEKERMFREKVDYLGAIIEDVKQHTPRDGETIINIKNLNRLKMTSLFAPIYACRFAFRNINKFTKNRFERSTD